MNSEIVEERKLDYAAGRAKLGYDTRKYDFRSLCLNELLLDEADQSLNLHEIHRLAGINKNIEIYRQKLFSLFRSDEFQAVYKKFGAELIDEHFSKDSLIQKTPTVRIQLPGAESTSYHSDGWYGHGKSVRSFWVPLTNVSDGNTLYMADDKNASLRCLQKISESEASLSEINNIAQAICLPFHGTYGDILTFSSDMIHGAKKNTTGWTRVSFDFRIAPNPDDIGSKPISNFFTREDLDVDTKPSTQEASQVNSTTYQAITYSNLCGGVSAKSQLMLCAAFCDANKIDVKGNESEIVTFSYMPVMRHYLSDVSSSIDTVVAFGIAVFEGNTELADNILDMAQANGKKLVFCAEGIVFDSNSRKSDILSLI